MSLTDWLKAQWLKAHKTSHQEIANLLGVADRDLRDCQVSGLSEDARLAIAYNAALQCAVAALAACGYQPSREAHHVRVILSLEYTIGADNKLVAQFDAFRKKRNLGDYEMAGATSKKEADEMVALRRHIGLQRGDCDQ
ncbi:MAG: hypothetical protein NT154_19700 [Verrucomicrobia bacterium]|nr:hypothetical protein [Verrucomicrobiota bacterium]